MGVLEVKPRPALIADTATTPPVENSPNKPALFVVSNLKGSFSLSPQNLPLGLLKNLDVSLVPEIQSCNAQSPPTSTTVYLGVSLPRFSNFNFTNHLVSKFPNINVIIPYVHESKLPYYLIRNKNFTDCVKVCQKLVADGFLPQETLDILSEQVNGLCESNAALSEVRLSEMDASALRETEFLELQNNQKGVRNIAVCKSEKFDGDRDLTKASRQKVWALVLDVAKDCVEEINKTVMAACPQKQYSISVSPPLLQSETCCVSVSNLKLTSLEIMLKNPALNDVLGNEGTNYAKRTINSSLSLTENLYNQIVTRNLAGFKAFSRLTA